MDINPHTEVYRPNFWADWTGMAASIGCAIHCAAMPLVVASLPSLGLAWLADDSFHRCMAVVCLVLALGAFVPGWRRHRSLLPAVLGGLGVASLLVASFALDGGCCPRRDTPSTGSALAESGCESYCTADACSMRDSPPTKPALAGPLMTPLGGLLLVSAHLINHRKSCCCVHGACRGARQARCD